MAMSYNPINHNNHTEGESKDGQYLADLEIEFDNLEMKEEEENEMETKEFLKFYGSPSVHHLMLKDTIRTNTFKRAILFNKHLFKGKIVLDVGCGTGILSLFAAQAGALRVIAVDCSEMGVYAQRIVKDNGMDKIITVINSRIEDIKEFPDGIEKVDIIISEWMGYCLFYESMMDTVLYARDKWLKEGGAIFPDIFTVHIAGIEDNKGKEVNWDWWIRREKTYYLNLEYFGEKAIQTPRVKIVPKNNVVTDHCEIIKIDLKTHKKTPYYGGPFELKVNQCNILHSFMVYFKAKFSACHTMTGFSTGPDFPYTHWKQTVFYIKKDFIVCLGDKIKGKFEICASKKNKRRLNAKISYSILGEQAWIHHAEQFYRF